MTTLLFRRRYRDPEEERACRETEFREGILFPNQFVCKRREFAAVVAEHKRDVSILFGKRDLLPAFPGGVQRKQTNSSFRGVFQSDPDRPGPQQIGVRTFRMNPETGSIPGETPVRWFDIRQMQKKDPVALRQIPIVQTSGEDRAEC